MNRRPINLVTALLLLAVGACAGSAGGQGPRGPTGPQGPPGPPGVANLNHQVVTKEQSLSPFRGYTGEVRCPAGKLAVGGGYAPIGGAAKVPDDRSQPPAR